MDDVIEEPKHKQRFVWVKDKAVNEYVCRIEDLRNPKNVTDEDVMMLGAYTNVIGET